MSGEVNPVRVSAGGPSGWGDAVEPTATLTSFLLARIAEDEANGWATSGLRAEPYSLTRPHLECEAKRRIVARHKSKRASDNSMTVCLGCGDEAPCPDVRDLAAVYVDHPDYNPNWRP